MGWTSFCFLVLVPSPGPHLFLGKCSTTELYSQFGNLFWRNIFHHKKSVFPERYFSKYCSRVIRKLQLTGFFFFEARDCLVSYNSTLLLNQPLNHFKTLHIIQRRFKWSSILSAEETHHNATQHPLNKI